MSRLQVWSGSAKERREAEAEAEVIATGQKQKQNRRENNALVLLPVLGNKGTTLYSSCLIKNACACALGEARNQRGPGLG